MALHRNFHPVLVSIVFDTVFLYHYIAFGVRLLVFLCLVIAHKDVLSVMLIDWLDLAAFHLPPLFWKQLLVPDQLLQIDQIVVDYHKHVIQAEYHDQSHE